MYTFQKLADMKIDFNLPDATWIAMTNQLMIHQVHTDFYPTVIGGVREDLLRGIMARFGIRHTINDPDHLVYRKVSHSYLFKCR
jgi:hypothetical protein